MAKTKIKIKKSFLLKSAILICFFVIIFCFNIFVPKVFAITSGPLGPGTMATDNSSGGAKDWTTPDNAKIEDAILTYAQSGLPPPPCLAWDTLIFTEKGDIPIKNLRVGDSVYSYNFVEKAIELREVSAVNSYPIVLANNQYFNIYFDSGNIRATFDHLFYVNDELIPAENLKIGDELFDINGSKKIITNIIIEENYIDYVYDISVNDNHNYFANGILVHNSGTYDKYIQIIKSDGSIGTTNRADANSWPGTLAYTTYGGSSDLWGETWTASDINSSNFGVAISAYGSGYYEGYTTYYIKATNFGFSIPDGATINGITMEVKKRITSSAAYYRANIDYIRITIDYSTGPGPLDHFALTLASPQANSTAFTGVNTLTAQDASNATITTFDASANNVTITSDGTITGLGSGSNNVLNQAGDFANGVADLTALGIKFTGTAASHTFTATSADAKTGVSGAVTINAGAAAKILVETAANGSGTVVPAQSVSSGSSITAYAISRDASNNFIANVASDSWSLTNKTSGVLDSDLTPAGDSKSATFTAHSSGTANIHTAKTGLASTDSGLITVPDITAPVRSNGSPSGSLSCWTARDTLSLSTDENATCRYSTVANTDYNSMAAMAATGTTSHTEQLTGLSAGASYNYYVRCRDTAANTNNTDYGITFQIDNYPSKGGGSSSSAAYISSQIQTIQNLIANLNKQINQASLSVPIVEFKQDIRPNSISNDVRELQRFLNSNGFTVSGKGPGSLGKETNIFGNLTKQALIKFQEKYGDQILKPLGLKKGTGIFGASTRRFVNSWGR